MLAQYRYRLVSKIYICVPYLCFKGLWGLVLICLGLPMIAHFEMPRSIHAHAQYLLSLFSWSWRDVSLLARAARSFA